MKTENRYAIYRSVMQVLIEHDVEFLVGGAYALAQYTGVERDTKDFDLLIRPTQVDQALAVWREAGYQAEYTFTHWLAKVRSAEVFVDVIFCSGNGLCQIDDIWFQKASRATVFGINALIVPPEELVWQKAYIMERERFDGADVIHLIARCGPTLDWDRLLKRFDKDWRVLWSHLILFGYVFPSKRDIIPLRIVQELNARVEGEHCGPLSEDKTCNGTFLSRSQYLSDIATGDFIDARAEKRCRMTPEERELWTGAGATPTVYPPR
ncbi:MAG: nucleotidyltransferase [Verrucomicrobia bacterium]|nr:nucleotidyltransferase [Verrucomicrobiota bacterium]